MSASRISEWELWACAQHYIKQHQDHAPMMAAMRADELLQTGDVDGANTFAAIARRIEKLLSAPAVLH